MNRASRYNHFQPRPGGHWLAYNARSGAMAMMTQDNYTMYERILAKLDQNGAAEFTPEEQQLLAQLQYGQFVHVDTFDELEWMRFQHYKARFEDRDLGLIIAPTLACNMACTYCFEGNKHGRMKPQVIEAVVAFVEKRAKHLRQFDVTWYGGEPLLAMDIIEDLTHSFLDLADEFKFAYRAGVISNGSLLSRESVDQLIDLKVVQAQITLDGPSYVHDVKRPLKNGKSSFLTIIDNLKYAVTKMGVALRVSIDKDMSAGAICDLLGELRAAGLQDKLDIYFGLVEPASIVCAGIADNCYDHAAFADIEAKFYQVVLDEGFHVHKTPTPIVTMCVAQQVASHLLDPNGELYRCFNYVGDKTKSIGNIIETLNFQHPEFTRLFKFSPFEDEHCRECSVLPLCMGGCPARRSDRADSWEDMCESWKFNLTPMLELIAASKQQRAQATQKESV